MWVVRHTVVVKCEIWNSINNVCFWGALTWIIHPAWICKWCGEVPADYSISFPHKDFVSSCRLATGGRNTSTCGGEAQSWSTVTITAWYEIFTCIDVFEIFKHGDVLIYACRFYFGSAFASFPRISCMWRPRPSRRPGQATASTRFSSTAANSTKRRLNLWVQPQVSLSCSIYTHSLPTSACCGSRTLHLCSDCE